MPQASVKAFTAIELAYMIRQAGLAPRDGLLLLKQSGMEAIPGGGAEIFAEPIRSRICPEKGTADEWLSMHREAHRIGIPTNATILYGHIESWEDRIDHLDRLRSLQDETGGFNAFIPLKYRSRNNSMSGIGEVSVVEDMRMTALARIYLDNFPHVKAYWPMFGKTTAQIAPRFRSRRYGRHDRRQHENLLDGRGRGPVPDHDDRRDGADDTLGRLRAGRARHVLPSGPGKRPIDPTTAGIPPVAAAMNPEFRDGISEKI